jgi:hypothetical protein
MVTHPSQQLSKEMLMPFGDVLSKLLEFNAPPPP